MHWRQLESLCGAVATLAQVATSVRVNSVSDHVLHSVLVWFLFKVAVNSVVRSVPSMSTPPGSGFLRDSPGSNPGSGLGSLNMEAHYREPRTLCPTAWSLMGSAVQVCLTNKRRFCETWTTNSRRFCETISVTRLKTSHLPYIKSFV